MITSLLLYTLTLAPSFGTDTVVVDASKKRLISPYIYGLNFPEWKKLDLAFPFVRQGGNRITAYNWENNFSNAGSDWHNQNDDMMGKTNEPGWAMRTFLEDAQSRRAACLITIPTLGYVSADKGPEGDVNQTPNYLDVRFLKSYPHKPGGHYTYPPNTKDRAVYQDECVAWLQKIAKKTTPLWYALDNEPDIWAGTHSRICLTKPTYASIIANNIDFASGIKSVAPKALVFGPAHYGWNGIKSFQDATDAGGRFFTDVYLDAMKQEEVKSGRRVLDVYDVHFYPEAQGDNTRITEEKASAGVYAARIQAPRSLWDPTYVERSWITQSNGGKPIRLLPDLQQRIRTHYPGTKLAVTEYNYGGSNHISGTIAQADVLGIYGRYGVFAASNWGMGPKDRAELAGFRAFLNYDQKGSKFGDLGLNVTGTNAELHSVYASLDSRHPDRLTMVLINKTDTPRSEKVSIKGFYGRSARAFAVTSNNFDRSIKVPVRIARQSVVVETPALSVTTVELIR
jgi:Glycoside hydrolase family 44